MYLFSIRRLAVCVVSAAALAAVAAPGAASAFTIEKCQGEEIKGQGSSLQTHAQGLWVPQFNSSICPGGPAKVAAYNPSGSGAGLKSWGVGAKGEYGPTNAYVGTDQPPNPTQKKEIEEGEGRAAGETLQTIPALQAAIAVVIHLPAGCTATSTAAPGRLVLKNATLEKIFNGSTSEWSKIKDGGDKFLGASCPILNKAEKGKPAALITRIVRADGSGTTATYKKYLFLKNKKPVDGTKTWNDLAEENPNTLWPNEAERLEKFAKNSGVVTKVATTPGTIGYANLADARVAAFTPAAGGKETSTFWAEIENGKNTYADPSTDAETSTTPTDANCANTVYTNGKKKFPPPTTSELWNEVNSSLKQENYTICGFTYDLSFSKFSKYPGTNEKEARTAFDYLGYEVSTPGQELQKSSDYLDLPTGTGKGQNVLKIAQEGAASIAF